MVCDSFLPKGGRVLSSPFAADRGLHDLRLFADFWNSSTHSRDVSVFLAHRFVVLVGRDSMQAREECEGVLVIGRDQFAVPVRDVDVYLYPLGYVILGALTVLFG